MPELPEVRTFASYLEKQIVNYKIVNTKLFVEKSNRTKIKIDSLKNETIKEISAKGKYLIFIANNYFLFFHLRLEGKLFVHKEYSRSARTLATFELSKGKTSKILAFEDFRKFGTIDIFEKTNDMYSLSIFKNIGKEPWDIDKKTFIEKIIKSKKDVKSYLLDQKNILGLGNIYVDEVLFHSRVMPTRKCIDLTKKEAELILDESIRILKQAIKAGGSSIRSYAVQGEQGKFQDLLKVHTKEGQICWKDNRVKKIKVGGRGTYYCPGYQK